MTHDALTILHTPRGWQGLRSLETAALVAYADGTRSTLSAVSTTLMGWLDLRSQLGQDGLAEATETLQQTVGDLLLDLDTNP